MVLVRPNTFEVLCPYCGHRNTFKLKPEQADALARIGAASATELVTCDNEDGGCDRPLVFEVKATVVFAVKVHALKGLDAAADDAASRELPDCRVWTLVTRGAEEPGGEQTEHFNAAQLEEMIPRAGRPLAALALTMRGGDSFDFTSVEGLITYHFTCYEPEPEDSFASFQLAKREARRRALQAGANQSIFFDGSRFIILRESSEGYDATRLDALEFIQAVEPPVVFRIELDRSGDAGEGRVAAEVICDDPRGNPDLLKRPDEPDGRHLIFYADSAPDTPEGIRETCEHAAAWIRSEFPTLDADIVSPVALEEDGDIPL